MPNVEVTFSISELAHEFEITPRTLRHYEELGLLSPRRKVMRAFTATKINLD